MAEHVHMAVYDTLADWEVGYATAHINNGNWQREPGRYQVVTVGASREPVRTMGGMSITPDIALDELGAEASAMLILPGADTWLAGGNGAFAKKARQFLEAEVPVAAICGATAGLAAEGLLDDRRHTSNAPEFLEAFGSKGAALYCDLPAVTDRGLITASGTAPVDFAREVLGALELYTPEVLASWYKLYGLGDPAGYFELMGEAA
ncbi:type 1 glutamine amidotransferase family protein [Glycomyces algeriensis]|uniref:Protease YoaZ n=1 Tax=Glycomyces algeriensis TaxID=256037 RepID=A0A9W6G9W0_9ACTN|nr:type 1 glutamine amidotransferase family protein [Glycomyces algeriensis]MDA1365626.1 glutamine amidotransferase [Glycomyces algeriensis]MDR7351314.1 putative intracellular protease/amidase [Glycomyces algeriensis]GLI44029.1 putative protease YoaZ [Glycomyces algeriensis]